MRAPLSVVGFVHAVRAPTALKSAFSATTQEALHNELIEAALHGLREEAQKVGANAVLGLRITTNSSDPAQTFGASFKSIETVIATGTAVVLSDSDETPSAVARGPF